VANFELLVRTMLLYTSSPSLQLVIILFYGLMPEIKMDWIGLDILRGFDALGQFKDRL